MLLTNLAAAAITPFYERAEWWQGIAGNVAAWAICGVIAWVAVKAAKVFPTVRDNSADAFKFGVEIAVILILGSLAFRLGSLSISNQATAGNPQIEADLSQVKQSLKTLNDRDAGLFWQPIPEEAKELIRQAMRDLGHLKFGVYRTDTSDCSMLAIQLAGLGEEAGW